MTVAARSSSQCSCSAVIWPRSLPGWTVSSTASVAPPTSIAYGAPSSAIDASSIASWLPRTWRIRSPSWPYAARNAAYSSSVPRFVRSPFTSTASGSSASISAIALRFIVSGYGGSPGQRAQHRAELLLHHAVELPALGLAEVHVVHGGDRGERLARPGPRASAPRPGGTRRRGAPSTATAYSVAGLEPVEAGEVVRTDGGRPPGPRPATRPSRPGSVTNVTTTSSGETVITSASRTLGRGHARLRRPRRPDRRHSPRE